MVVDVVLAVLILVLAALFVYGRGTTLPPPCAIHFCLLDWPPPLCFRFSFGTFSATVEVVRGVRPANQIVSRKPTLTNTLRIFACSPALPLGLENASWRSRVWIATKQSKAKAFQPPSDLICFFRIFFLLVLFLKARYEPGIFFRHLFLLYARYEPRAVSGGCFLGGVEVGHPRCGPVLHLPAPTP